MNLKPLRFPLIAAAIVGGCTNPITPKPAAAPSVTPLPPTASLVPSATTPPSTVPASATPSPFPEIEPGLADWLQFERWTSNQIGWAIDRSTWRILRTEDGGESWRDVTPGENPIAFVDALDDQRAWTSYTSLDPTDPNGVVYRTSDGGRTWKEFGNPYKLQSVRFVDDLNGWGIASPQGCGAGSCWLRLYRSTNGGETWSALEPADPYGNDPIDDILGPGTISLLSGHTLSFSDPQTVWVSGDYTLNTSHGRNAILIVSRNAGGSWQQLQVPMPASMPGSGIPTFVGAPQFFSAEDAVFVAWYAARDIESPGGYLALFHSNDGGRSWESGTEVIPVFPYRNAVDIVSPQLIFALCGEMLCVTEDAGASWEQINSNFAFFPGGDHTLIDFSFISRDHGWALIRPPESPAYLFRTEDGGATWNPIRPTVSGPD